MNQNIFLKFNSLLSIPVFGGFYYHGCTKCFSFCWNPVKVHCFKFGPDFSHLDHFECKGSKVYSYWLYLGKLRDLFVICAKFVFSIPGVALTRTRDLWHRRRQLRDQLAEENRQVAMKWGGQTRYQQSEESGIIIISQTTMNKWSSK